MPRITKSARAAANSPTASAAVLIDKAATAFVRPAQLSAALHERYPDFQPVYALIAEWEPHQPATPE